MTKKKICHLSTTHNASNGRLLDRECIKLVNAGYDVTLIALNKKKFEIISGVKVLSFPRTHSRIVRITILNIYMLIKALKQNSQLYHIHDPELLLVGYILKLFNKRVVYDVHEDYPKQVYNKHYIPKIFIPLVSFIIEYVENFFSKKLDGLITVVPTINDRFLKINSNTIMYRNFPDIHLVDSVKSLKKNKDYFTIIYTGTLSKKRGVEDAINLANLYNGKVKLILAGNWESHVFEDNCKKLKGWRYVKFLGRITQKKVYSYMKSSDLGIHLIHDMPTSRIGYPMKAFEFMACELPFVISNIGNKKKLFYGVCKFIKPGNIKDIKNKVDYLIKNNKIRKKLAQNGRKKALSFYNLDFELNNFLNFYSSIISKIQ